MGNKHMKRHSTPLVLREAQVKAAVRAPHTHEDGQHLQDGELQVLARMWRKWSSRTLLAGMQDGAAALGAPQKLKHKEGFHTQVHSQQKKKKKKKLGLHKPPYTNTQSDAVHSGQKVGTQKCPPAEEERNTTGLATPQDAAQPHGGMSLNTCYSAGQ